MRFCDALNIQKGDVVAFVGAGGKTTAMHRLGTELAAQGWRVIATTTTRIARHELDLFPCHIRWQARLLRGERLLAKLLDEHRFVFVYQNIRSEKARGIPEEYITRLLDGMNADVMLIEADGSRRLPLKAPLHYEPVLPGDTTLVVPIAGWDAVGQPFDEQVVYNIDSIAERYGFPYGAPIQPAWIAQILRDQTFGLKDVPSHARIIPLINKAHSKGLERARARRAANIILREPRVNAVALGAVRREKDPVYEVHHRVAAIILAAGLSRRMGECKVLLPWGKRTVLENIVQTLIPFRLSDVVVVTGYKSEQVEAAIDHLPVRTVFNPAYAVGEMVSSLKAGIKSLDDSIDACMVIMGDQPQLRSRVVRRVLQSYNHGAGDLVAPYFNEQRGHPVLIHRRYWPEILDLPFQSAPREVLNRYDVHPVYVDEDSILRDIDTPERYEEEKRLAGLD